MNRRRRKRRRRRRRRRIRRRKRRRRRRVRMRRRMRGRRRREYYSICPILTVRLTICTLRQSVLMRRDEKYDWISRLNCLLASLIKKLLSLRFFVSRLTRSVVFKMTNASRATYNKQDEKSKANRFQYSISRRSVSEN